MTSELKSLCEAFQRTAAVDPDAIALRTVGGATTVTWRQYADRVRKVAAGLAAVGVRPGSAVALMMTNRPEFHIVDTATLHLGAAPFSMYNTSSPEQIAYLLENSSCDVVVCERQYVEKVRAAGRSGQQIIVVDGSPGVDRTLADLEAAGDPGFDFDASWRAVGPDDVLTLIYTSGTTGNPKGVELTHGNVLAELATLATMYGLRRGDRFTSYLPSAHVADRMAAHYAQMHYGTQLTTVDDPRKVAEALPDVRPTYWFAVPRVWEKMKGALESAFAEQHGPKAHLLQHALALGRKQARAQARGERVGVLDAAQLAALDRLVLSKVRAKLGLGELRWALSGAASISADTLEFFLALGIKVSEIWGMSECCGAATGNPLDRIKTGTVGTALPGIDLRLDDDGEVLIRGAMIMRGYRNDPVRTAEVLDSDGWLRTGDIASIDGDGYLTIIDRKKELIINAAGKNMSPSNIENAIASACPLIAQAVTIGDARPYNTALVVLDPEVATTHAGDSDLPGSAAALAADAAIIAAVAQGVARGNARLSRVEQIKRFRILPEFWEPGGVEITATMKLRRKPILQKYAAEIDELYEADLPPHIHEPVA